MKTDLTAFSAGKIQVKYRLIHEPHSRFSRRAIPLWIAVIGLFGMGLYLTTINVILGSLTMVFALAVSQPAEKFFLGAKELNKLIYFSKNEMRIEDDTKRVIKSWNYVDIDKIQIDVKEIEYGGGQLFYEDSFTGAASFEVHIVVRKKAFKFFAQNRMYLNAEDRKHFKSPEPDLYYVLRMVAQEEHIPIYAGKTGRHLPTWDGGI